jgi:hypothetical protein
MYKWQPWEQKRVDEELPIGVFEGPGAEWGGWILFLNGDETEESVLSYTQEAPHPPDFIIAPDMGTPKGNLTSAWNVERMLTREEGNFDGTQVVSILPQADRPIQATFLDRCGAMEFAVAIPKSFPTTDNRPTPTSRFSIIRSLQVYLPLIEKGVILLDYSEEEEDTALLPLLKNIDVEWEMFLDQPKP